MTRSPRKLYREWCPKKNDRDGRMVAEPTIDQIVKTQHNPGYAGVYAFDEAAAKAVLESKSSKGLGQYDAYADRLVIDIDDVNQVAEVEAKLHDKGLGYDKWFSGSKGYHYILRHELIGSKDLPWSHRRYVEDVLKIPCDVSLYQHGRLLSLPGRVHEKTKRKKVLVETVEGLDVDLELQHKPEIAFTGEDIGVTDLGAALLNLQLLGTVEPRPGSRHTAIWGTAKDLKRAGIDYQTTLSLMLAVNHSWVNQKTEEEVTCAVSQAYQA